MVKKFVEGESRKQGRKVDITVKCLAFYFILMPFDSFPMFGMGSILKIIALLPVSAILVIHRKHKLILNKLTISFLVYVFVNIVSCMYSVNLSASMTQIIRLVLNGMLMIVAGGMSLDYRIEDVEYLIKALVVGGVFTVFMTLIFSGTSADGRITMAVNGTMQDPNYINGYMYIAFTYAVSRLIGEKKVLNIVPAVFLIIFTLMTGSRGATLGLGMLVVSVFFFYMFCAGKIRYGILILAFVLLAVLAFSFDYLLSLLPESVAMRFSIEFIKNYRGTKRTELWIEILKIYREGNVFRKLFGYGYGTVAYVNSYNHLVAHNLWLDHLISGGIIGVCVLGYMQMQFITESWRKRNVVLFASYVGYLTMCVTLSLTNYKPMWNCMMMIMILHNCGQHCENKRG